MKSFRRGSRADRLSLDLARSGRITDILNGRRSITPDTAVRLSRYFGSRAQFWLDLQSQYDIFLVERERGEDRAPGPPRLCDLSARPFLLTYGVG
jgi:addiction module HigA family antidote